MGENSRHPTGEQEKGGLGAAAIVGAAASHAIDQTRPTLKLCCRAMGRLLSTQASGQASGPSIRQALNLPKRSQEGLWQQVMGPGMEFGKGLSPLDQPPP
jgi:hypothetical protein